MSKNSSYILRKKNEATGMRVVSQYVQEFWNCGWQPLDQRNDKGIDGIIILRKRNIDLGVRINVQVKCGSGYISSEDKNEIRISIGDSSSLLQHLKYWKTQLEPVLLVFVNPGIKVINKATRKFEYIENRLNPIAYWVDVKSDDFLVKSAETLIRIPKVQRFGEHSKGYFLSTAANIVAQKSYQCIKASKEAITLFNSDDLVKDARAFYKSWKSNKVTCKAINGELRVSRTGWRHILLSRRGKEKRRISLQLLGAAKDIIENIEEMILVNQTENSNSVIQKYALRGKIEFKTFSINAQVILLRRIKKINSESSWMFYSVHSRK